MVLHSLREALSLLIRMPIIWLSGIVAGAAVGIDLYLELSGEAFFGGKILLLGLLALPFCMAGSIGAINRAEGSLEVFLEEGRKGYFRVLLPALVLLFAVIVTIFLLAVPLSIILGGNAIEAAASTALGVIFTFALFAYFTDTTAVTGGHGVFASIQQSTVFVLSHLSSTILFYLANLAALCALGFGGVFVWTVLLYDRLAPLAESGDLVIVNTTSAAAAQAEFAAILGPEGIWASALVYALIIAVFVPFALAFKTVFYLRHAGEMEAPVQGEYDEKGRWYKY
ncbi:DUF7847 domain-containing protein [Methanofollis fontis]|uniref:Uncharacterized protein n=1 Tax=Methanofollis fontis TaxID=2052832 RepID=A0A483CSZ4_9EURY|nr:hypothetical protein [Methanofollis fontis]TAJ44235.1 hypothetical protein CUJ86_09450 [Methanofollis fontis]